MKVSFSYVGAVAFIAKWSLKVILLHEISSFRMGRKNDVVRRCSCEMDSICAILVYSSCILQFRLRNTTFTFSQNVCTSSSPSTFSYQCCQLYDGCLGIKMVIYIFSHTQTSSWQHCILQTHNLSWVASLSADTANFPLWFQNYNICWKTCQTCHEISTSLLGGVKLPEYEIAPCDNM